ncbi:MAG: type II toxin-antitoxin system RelE/ParE family toxin [Cyanobacteria bacterium P01_C01_bin.120]
MANFRLSAQAEADLTAIWMFVAERDDTAADNLIASIVNQIAMLANFSRAGRDLSELLPGLRSFVVGRHVIFYRVITSDLEVIRILHGSRDVQRAFEAFSDKGSSDTQEHG